MSFSQRFTRNAEAFLTNPAPEQMERLDYAQRLLEGLQLVSRVATIDGYARDLDYDLINEDELNWIGIEIYKFPNPNSNGDDFGEDPTGSRLRDQVARIVFNKGLTYEKIIMLPSQRQAENYF